MDSYGSLLEAFEALNDRKRLDPEGLTRGERDRWKRMRREIEEALFSQAPVPGADKREFMRVPVSLAVRYWTRNELRDRFITVMGENGLFVATSEPHPVGTRIDLEITLVQRGRSFKVQGEVVWVNQDSDPLKRGMGIRFVELNQVQRQNIFSLVDASLRHNLLERRRHARLDSRVPVQFLYSEGSFELPTEDIGLGGLFIASEHLVQSGEWVRVNLRLPDDMPVVKLVAEVVRGVDTSVPGKPAGIGVRFLDPEPTSMAAIQRHLVNRVAGGMDPYDVGSGKRQYPRVKRRVKLRLQSSGISKVAWCRDISLGGVFAQSQDPLPKGSTVEVGVIHPLARELLLVPGQVLRVVQPDPAHPHRVPGVAISFQLSERKREQVQQLLKDFVLLQTTNSGGGAGQESARGGFDG